MRLRSFRLRLTVWYLALFTALFLLFSVFLYGLLSTALRDRLDESLRSEAATAAGMFEDELQETGDLSRAASETVSGMRVGHSVIAVFVGGALLAGDPAHPAPQVAEMPSTGQVGTLPHYGRNGARAVARRVRAPGRDAVIVALGPLDAIAAELRLVRRVLSISLPLVLGLAGIGGYLLASRSLAPLGWMAKQAHEIGGASLHRRLEIGDAAQELTTLAASFNELLGRLDQSFETMRRFVADASHELRTPLSVIRGEADVALAQDRGAAEYKAALGIILDESRRLSRLVDDLLNLARADSGHVKLHLRDFYFNDLLAECCRSAQAAASARDIELECSRAEDAPYQGDQELLRRMLMNLLDNAIRYTPQGGKVSAALKLELSALKVRISDTGPGIVPEAATQVFDRFFRADEARSRQNGGFGLGLSIVKWIAEAHNGAVELASQPGAGSVFTVTLPR